MVFCGVWVLMGFLKSGRSDQILNLEICKGVLWLKIKVLVIFDGSTF